MSGRRHRSPAAAGAAALLTAGLGTLGWVGWSFVGTNVVAQHEFDATATSLRHQWAEHVARDAGAQAPARAARPGEPVALLRVPAFGPHFEVPVLEGTSLPVLGKGVGHYTGAALPGQVGNFAVAGHRVTHGEPFARLLELERGDEVVVEVDDTVFTYVLDGSPEELVVDDTETWVLDPVPRHPGAEPTRPTITLTTCEDLFHSADRAVGFGHLVDSRPKR